VWEITLLGLKTAGGYERRGIEAGVIKAVITPAHHIWLKTTGGTQGEHEIR